MKDIKSKSIKMVIKVSDPVIGGVHWVHLCYVERELYLQYLKEMDITSNDLNEVLSRWVKENFKIDLPIKSVKDLEVLRNFVKDYYKQTYPDLYIESPTDNQGWMRVWVTKRMKEDLIFYEN